MRPTLRATKRAQRLVDAISKEGYEVVRTATPEDGLSLVSVGGTGRAERAPASGWNSQEP